MSQLVLRKIKNEDVNFITNSWLKSYRNSKDVKSMTNTEFYGKFHGRVEEHLRNDFTMVAVSPDNENQIIGYLNYETQPSKVNWIYVKHLFRQMGIANALFEAAGLDKPLDGRYSTHSWENFILKIPSPLKGK